MSEATPEIKEGRVRKQVEQFQATDSSSEKEIVIEKGDGIELSTFDLFVENLGKHTGDSDLVNSALLTT